MKNLLLAVIIGALALSAQRSPTFNLGTLSAVGATFGVNVGPVAHWHTLQVVVTGAPATCGIQLEGTLDDVQLVASPAWANLSGSQVCTSTVTFHVVDRAVTAVRANLTILSGGTSPTVSVKYVGVQ